MTKPNDDMLDLFEQESESINVPSDEALSVVQDLARRQISLEDRLAELETETVSTAKVLRTVSETDIPEALEEIGIDSFSLTSGEAVVVEKKMKAGIAVGKTIESALKAARGYQWLKDHNAGALVKSTLVLTFGKGKKEKELQAKAKELLEEAKIPFEEKEAVHWQTLTSHVKECLNDGRRSTAKLSAFTNGSKQLSHVQRSN